MVVVQMLMLADLRVNQLPRGIRLIHRMCHRCLTWQMVIKFMTNSRQSILVWLIQNSDFAQNSSAGDDMTITTTYLLFHCYRSRILQGAKRVVFWMHWSMQLWHCWVSHIPSASPKRSTTSTGILSKLSPMKYAQLCLAAWKIWKHSRICMKIISEWIRWRKEAHFEHPQVSSVRSYIVVQHKYTQKCYALYYCGN